MSFNMPIFFFISGYIAQKGAALTGFRVLGKFMWSKTTLLIIPLLFWGIVVYPMFFYPNFEYIKTMNILSAVAGQFTNPTYWFLLALFKLYIFFALFNLSSSLTNRSKRIVVDVLILAILYCPYIIIFYFQRDISILKSCLFVPFFFGGVLISKYDVLRSFIKKTSIFTISTILFILLCGNWSTEVDTPLSNDVLKVVCATFAIISMYNIVQRITWSEKVDNMIQLFGRNTFVIYLVHFPFTHLLHYELGTVPAFVVALLLSVVISYCCILFGRIIATVPILSMLMFGTKLSKP